MSKSGEGEKQGQYCGSRQPCDKDRAAQGSAENDLAASGLLGRIRRCRAFVPFCHRWIGSVSMHPLGFRQMHAALALCRSQIKARRNVPGRPAQMSRAGNLFLLMPRETARVLR